MRARRTPRHRPAPVASQHVSLNYAPRFLGWAQPNLLAVEHRRPSIAIGFVFVWALMQESVVEIEAGAARRLRSIDHGQYRRC